MPQRIVILSMVYPPMTYGLSLVSYHLACEYSALNYDVHVITGTPPIYSQQNANVDNITVHRIRLPKKHSRYADSNLIKSINLLYYNLKSVCILYKLRPSIIHCQSPYTSIAGYISTIIFNIPYCISFHEEINNHGFILPAFLSRIWDKLPYIKNAKKIFALTQNMHIALQSHNINSVIVQNGVNIIECHPINDNLRPHNEKSTIICVGRLIATKRIDDAIHAIYLVSKQIPNIKLLIIGDGPERANLEYLASSLCLEKIVSFIGRVNQEDVIKYYQQSDVFLQTSESEGFSLVAIEAMACGLPIVSTPVGIVPELISGADNGYLVKFNNPSDAADKICKILGLDFDEYSQMSKRSVVYAQKYSWDKIAEQYLKEYSLNNESGVL